MKQPRARVRFTDAIQEAIDNPGEFVLYKEMRGSSALQSARKMNPPKVDGGVDGLTFWVEDGNLYVKYDG